MKKTLTALVAVVLLVTMVLTLASCTKKPSGKYGNAVYSVEFDGNKVSVSLIGGALSTKSGTFEMEDNKIVITYESEDLSGKLPTGMTYDAENDTVSFLGLTLKKDK